jgi:26S proteasome non-ATPase regulatory subunit 9
MVEEHRLLPFARVDAVAADSPAKDAGLKEEDLIVRFGHIHADNNDRLRAIAALVPEVAAENGEIDIEIVRRTEEPQQQDQTQDASNVTVAASEQDYSDASKWERISIKLQPRPWSGRGLIGAHVVPFTV